MILLALTLFAGIQNPVAAAPQVLFLVAVVVKMWSRDPWSGYGAALVLIASVIGSVLLWIREGQVSKPLATATAVSVLLAGMYWLTGRALGSFRPLPRGIPWLVFAALLLLFPLFFQAFVVPTGGMENTILQGDSLIIRRQFGRMPQRADIVAFRYPLDRRQSFLKRVVAVPGDRVRLENKKLILNGSPVTEPWAVHTARYPDALRDNFPEPPDYTLPSAEWQKVVEANAGKEIQVPAGKVFVLGDNRDSSLDSRHWGFIDQSDVIGEPVLVYWSEERRRLKDQPDTFVGRVRWTRVFHTL